MALYAMWRLLVVGLVAGAVGVNVAAADEASAVLPGSRVRLTVPTVSGSRLIGTVVALDDAMLTLQRQDAKDALRVPRGAITRIELSRHRSRKATGAGIGALVGIGAAAAIGLGAGESCAPNAWLCFDKTDMMLISGILTVPAGTLIGLAAAPGEKWDVTTPDRLRVAVAPVRGGVRAALAVRF